MGVDFFIKLSKIINKKIDKGGIVKITKESIKEYAEKYDQRHKGTSDEIIEKEIKKWLAKNRYLNREQFIKIGLWKSKRPKKKYENNDDLTVRKITRFSFATNDEQARIKFLLLLNGVAFPVASAILHFAFPDKYPILDFRAIWSLGWKQPKSYTFDFWQKYCNEMEKISKKTGESIRTIDKAFWEYSKENQVL
ncbi:MAG: hypothetical protein PHE59_04140 [Patescibacteria group bacterium]|nr:hypothetical protein [Patescibacteria group bacterium]MDD5164480.1 hypothetical protein [Patescibacteria group bacterium]MDD5534399.1 hypothetical protein [Patescibacteria group bacterium]